MVIFQTFPHMDVTIQIHPNKTHVVDSGNKTEPSAANRIGRASWDPLAMLGFNANPSGCLSNAKRPKPPSPAKPTPPVPAMVTRALSCASNMPKSIAKNMEERTKTINWGSSPCCVTESCTNSVVEWMWLDSTKVSFCESCTNAWIDHSIRTPYRWSQTPTTPTCTALKKGSKSFWGIFFHFFEDFFSIF